MADREAPEPVRALKQVVLQAGYHAGVFRLAQFARRRQAVIVTFHRFRDNGRGDTRGVPIARFAECLEYLVRHYRVVSLAELTRELRRGVARPNVATVSVDDGYHEVFSLAAPVLRRYGVPASLFVVSQFADGELWLWPDRFRFVFERAARGPVEFRHRGATHVLALGDEAEGRRAEARWYEHAKRLTVTEREELLTAIAEAGGVDVPRCPPGEYRAMTWAQLRALAAEGFDVAAHTRTHPILSRIAPAQLRNEIGGCKEEIEGRLGRPVRHFAYPNGRPEDYTPAAVAEVARAGYLAAVTTIGGGNTPTTPVFELRRISERAEDVAHFAQAVSGVDVLKQRLRGPAADTSGERH